MRYTEDEIRDYVTTNWHHFGPDGLGYNRPSGLIQHYAKHPGAFSVDLVAVDDLRAKEQEREIRERAEASRAERGERTASGGVSQANLDLFASIRHLAAEGHSPGMIAAMLEYNEAGIRNVLALRGPYIDDQNAILDQHVKGFAPDVGRHSQGGGKDRWIQPIAASIVIPGCTIATKI